MIKLILSKIGFVFRNNKITFKVNDRIGPIDRSLTYTEPLENFLQSKNWGTVINEGTFLQKNGEISACDITIELTPHAKDKLTIGQITSFLERLGMPKGSVLIVEQTKTKMQVGKMEGLALYLNRNFISSAGLSPEQVENFAKSLHDKVGHTNLVDRSWSDKKEDAAYFYNISFQEMQIRVHECLKQFNLTKYARMEQIA